MWLALAAFPHCPHLIRLSCSLPLMPEMTRQRHHLMFLSSEPFIAETGYFPWCGVGREGWGEVVHRKGRVGMSVPEHLSVRSEPRLGSQLPDRRGWWRTRMYVMDEHKDAQQCACPPVLPCRIQYYWPLEASLNPAGLPSPNRSTCLPSLRPLT